MGSIREVVIDTETTGLEIKEGHRIIEIGCVELVNRVKTGRTFHAYVNPLREVEESAFEVHGLSTEFLKGYPPFPKVASDFLEFISTSNLIIHNAQFDMNFINNELALMGLKRIPDGRAVDTLLLARKKFPGMPATLDALCKRFNISLKSRDKHGALIDSELLAQVYMHLLGGPQSTLNLSTSSKTNGYKPSITDFPKRSFKPSDKEIEEHKGLLSKINNNLWYS